MVHCSKRNSRSGTCPLVLPNLKFIFLTIRYRSGSKYNDILPSAEKLNTMHISAIQVYYMAELMNIMFTCVFGYKYKDWNPAVPASAGTDAKTILNCMFPLRIFESHYNSMSPDFLAWTVSLPLSLLHPSKLRIVFTIRVILAFTAFFTMFGMSPTRPPPTDSF